MKPFEFNRALGAMVQISLIFATGEQAAQAEVCQDATAGTFNQLLASAGFRIPSGTKYIGESCTLAASDTQTRAYRETGPTKDAKDVWTIVLPYGSSLPAGAFPVGFNVGRPLVQRQPLVGAAANLHPRRRSRILPLRRSASATF